MRLVLAITVATCGLSGLVQAQTTKQRDNFIETTSLVMYAEQRCPKLRLNMAMWAAGAMALKIEIKDLDQGGELHQNLQAAMEKTRAAFGEKDATGFCEIVEDGFGSGGTMIPNLIRRR